MNTTPDPTPDREDPLVDRWLSTLAPHDPGPHFAEAVMARVYRPLPSWVRALQAVTRRERSRGTVWRWAGGAALASTACMVLVGFWMTTHWMQVETTAVSVVAWASPWWRSAITAGVDLAAWFGSVGNAPEFGAGTWAVVGLLGMGITIWCLWGLLHLVRTPTGRMATYANA